MECFPGKDHIEHYAEIIAAWLRLTKETRLDLTNPSLVSFRSASPFEAQAALQATNLGKLPNVDTVILGTVHHLEELTMGA